MAGSMTPYYSDDYVTLWHGDCREVSLPAVDLVCTDPPYPNRAGLFIEDVQAAVEFMGAYDAPRWMVFWHQLSVPPVRLPLVAQHIWHRTNSNRPDNYEAIYEFADEPERASRVFPFAVISPGLTGCYEATGHPTQKNVKLMTRLIALRKALTVLDPFAGSGSTLIAAKWLGRQAFGVEKSETYCESIASRLAQEVLDFGGAA